MKITGVKAYPIGFEFEYPFISSVQKHQKRTTTLVKIVADNGIVGWGEAYGPPVGISKIIEEYLQERLLGQDPFRLEFWWNQVQTQKGIPRGAIGGVDIALWDMKAKSLKMPLYELLGGKFIDEITPYATGFFLSEDNPDSTEYLEKEAESVLEKGFKAIKMKIGFGIDRDIKRMEKMREIIGNNIKLMVDANQGYNYMSCMQLKPIFEDLDIFWLEEPMPWSSFSGYKELKQKTDFAIAAGESEISYQGFIEAIKNQIIDVIQPDLSAAGGITILRKIAVLAEAFNIEFQPHAFGTILSLPASIQLMASLSNNQSWAFFPKQVFMEWDTKPNNMARDILNRPLDIVDGVYKISDHIGIGVDVNEEAIKYYEI